MRPSDLAQLTDHFYNTGDALPALMPIVMGMTERGRQGLETCPVAAVLAQLLELERRIHKAPLGVTRRSLGALRSFWRHLSPALRWPARNATRGGLEGRAAPEGRGEEQAAMRSLVSEGFVRVERQLGDLRRVVRQRAAEGFEAVIVMPICWPADERALLTGMKFFFRPGRMRWCRLILYDCCYGLLSPGSKLYSMSNDVEIDLASPDNGLEQRQAAARWASEKRFRWLQNLAACFGGVVVVPFHQEIHLPEVTTILHYIATHYDGLPDVVLYLQPDFYEHVSPEVVETLINTLSYKQWPPGLSFLYLGHRHPGPVDEYGRVSSEPRSYCSARKDAQGIPGGPGSRGLFAGVSRIERTTNRTPSGSMCLWYDFVWEVVFQRPFELPADDFGGYDFSQIAFTREAALRRPRSWWARVWRAFCTQSNYQLLPGTRFVSWVDLGLDDHWKAAKRANNRRQGYHKGLAMVFENIWHAFFFPEAEVLLWQTRLRDPDVPLSFKFSIHNSNNPGLLRYYRWTPHRSGHAPSTFSGPSNDLLA